MKKVLHLIHGLNAGGAEALVTNYFLNFKNNKISYTLLCLEHRRECLFESILEDSGVDLLYVEDYLPFKNNTNRVCKLINRLARRIIVRKIIRQKDPDIIHTHLKINSFLRFVRPRCDTIIIITVHSDPNKIWGGEGSKRDYYAVNWLIRHYKTFFVVLHNEMMSIIHEIFDVSNTMILNNGVDVERIRLAKNRERLRRELKISESAFVMGHVGRFSYVKNQDFLVDIFIEIAKIKGNAFLLMVGDGPDKGKIIKKLENNGLGGKYLILSNRNDVPDLLTIMDVFIFPSLYEGLPLSLIEAQVARKPCFISDAINKYADISNLITRLSLQQEAKEWSETILSYKKPKRIIVNDEEWDIKKITKKLEDIYLKVLEERNEKK